MPYGLTRVPKGEKPRTVAYERRDKDVVHRYRVVRDEIYLRGSEMSLENQIRRLEDEIAATSSLKAKLDAYNSQSLSANELEAFLNEFAAMPRFPTASGVDEHLAELTVERDKLQALHDDLNKLKVEAIGGV